MPFLRILCGLALTTTSASAQAVRQSHSEVELLCEYAAWPAGTSCWVAIRLVPDQGWHSYWRNAGDTGLAPEVAWNLPDGFAVGALQFGVPERIASPPSFSYGYHGESLLLARLSVPSLGAVTGRVEAQVSWMVCKEACVAGRANLVLDLPVAAAPPRHARAALLDAAVQRLPAAPEGWSMQAVAGQEWLNLWIQKPGGLKAPGERVYFFAGGPEVVDHSAEQQWMADRAGPYLRIPRSPYAAAWPDHLEGVLRAGETAVTVNLRVEKAD